MRSASHNSEPHTSGDIFGVSAECVSRRGHDLHGLARWSINIPEARQPAIPPFHILPNIQNRPGGRVQGGADNSTCRFQSPYHDSVQKIVRAPTTDDPVEDRQQRRGSSNFCRGETVGPVARQYEYFVSRMRQSDGHTERDAERGQLEPVPLPGE